MKNGIEGKSFIKISTASKEIDVDSKEYHSLLEAIRIRPMPPMDGTILGNFRVTLDAHEKVKAHLRDSINRHVGDDTVNDNKDFQKAMEAFEEGIKTNKSTVLEKRRGADYYTTEKLAEIQAIVDDVNKKIGSSRVLLGNGYESIKFNEYLESTYCYSKQDTLPTLLLRANKKYGYQVYLKYFVLEEVVKEGKIVKERKIKQWTGYLNRTDEKKLYWNAIFTAMFIYDKIKLGYFIRLKGKSSNSWNLITSTPPMELYLIPTLQVYLEHFKKNGFKARYASSMQGNINHLIRFLHPEISNTEEIKYEELSHSMKFTDFAYQKVTKFIEYLRKTPTARTKKPASGRTISNIVANLGNLVTLIVKRHEPAFTNYANPFLKHDIRVEKRAMHAIYSKDQLSLLIKAIRKSGDVQLLALVYIMYFTGCRRIEAQRLKIGNIELDAAKIRFYKLEEAGRTKTTERTITMHPDLKKVLATLSLEKYSKTDFLFSPKRVPGPTQVSHNYFQLHFQKLRLKIPELTNNHGLYGLKHTFSTNFLKSATSPKDLEDKKRQLQEMLGHQSFNETMTYIQGLDLSDLFPQGYDGLQRLED